MFLLTQFWYETLLKILLMNIGRKHELKDRDSILATQPKLKGR